MTIRRVRGLVDGQEVELDIVGDVADALATATFLGLRAAVRPLPAILCPERPGNRPVVPRMSPGCHEYVPSGPVTAPQPGRWYLHAQIYGVRPLVLSTRYFPQ